jgi:hypothetical protein
MIVPGIICVLLRAVAARSAQFLSALSPPARGGLRIAEPTAEVKMVFQLQRNMGLLVLAIWLILYGLSGLVALGLPSPLMAILALIAGVLILAGR